MNIRVFILILMSLVFSCKTAKYKRNDIIELSDYIELLKKKNLVGENPLIVLNGIAYKNFNAFGDSDIKLKKNRYSSLMYIMKESNYFINLFGKEAKNGIITIDTVITIYCKRYTKVVYLFNDEEVDSDEYLNKLDELTESKKEIMTYWNEIKNIPSKDNDRMYISIVNTKLITNNK